MTKIPNFQTQDGGRQPFKKIILSLYLSRKSSDFNEIWYAVADCVSKDGYLTKYRNFTNSEWRMAAVLKIVFWLYLKE